MPGYNPGAFPGRGPGGLYPPGQGPFGRPSQESQPRTGFAEGTQDVQGGIGSPNTSAAYGPPITLTAPQIQQAAQKAGLSTGQISGLMQAFKGFEGMGGGGAATDVSGGYYGLSQSPGGYQGGISDIGYPPFVTPNAEYHADKGSTWEGPYDPNYLVQRYARGTASVPFR